MAVGDNAGIARRFLEIWGQGSLDLIEELAAPDITVKYPVIPMVIRRRRLYRRVMEGFRAAFPDSGVTVLEEVDGGERVVLRWSFTGTHSGPLLGILGTVYGVLIAFQGMGRYGSASIDAVAPGISEALITTVFGLIVAIPALVLYNYFQHSLKNLVFQLDNFIADFIDRARREYSPEAEKKPPAGPTP